MMNSGPRGAGAAVTTLVASNNQQCQACFSAQAGLADEPGNRGSSLAGDAGARPVEPPHAGATAWH